MLKPLVHTYAVNISACEATKFTHILISREDSVVNSQVLFVRKLLAAAVTSVRDSHMFKLMVSKHVSAVSGGFVAV